MNEPKIHLTCEIRKIGNHDFIFLGNQAIGIGQISIIWFDHPMPDYKTKGIMLEVGGQELFLDQDAQETFRKFVFGDKDG